MAGETGRIFIHITGNPIMANIRFRVQVANNATEFRIIRGIGMTGGAVRPLALVFATVYRKVLGIVLQICCRRPVWVRGMALCTIIREIGRNVIGIQCIFKIRQVTRDTGA